MKHFTIFSNDLKPIPQRLLARILAAKRGYKYDEVLTSMKDNRLEIANVNIEQFDNPLDD